MGLSIEGCLSICRIRTTFADSCGNEEIFNGTCFWIKDNSSKNCIVTNRHNVDCSYNYSNLREYELKKVEIELRDTSLDKTRPTPRFFTLEACCLAFHDSDVVILKELDFGEKEPQFPIYSFPIEWFADDLFFENFVKMSQELFFLGFPHSKFDKEGHFPVSGHALISSWPTRSFRDDSVKEQDIVLIQGKSLSGASGSPVITLSRGVKFNTDEGSAQTGDYCPQKIIGILGGHFYKDEDLVRGENRKQEEFLNHSDYSYFIRSTSILYILENDSCSSRNYIKHSTSQGIS